MVASVSEILLPEVEEGLRMECLFATWVTIIHYADHLPKPTCTRNSRVMEERKGNRKKRGDKRKGRSLHGTFYL